jgi:hypothetical protein
MWFWRFHRDPFMPNRTICSRRLEVKFPVRCAAVAAAVVLYRGAVRADVVPVTDPIFSGQLVPLTDTGGAYPLLPGDGWSDSGPANLSQYGFFEGTVVWQNPPAGRTGHVDNLPADNSVTQAMCNAVDPASGQWVLPYQGCASVVAETGNQLTQTLGATFAANTSYQLTVALGTNDPSDGYPVPESTAGMQLALFYTDGSGVEHIVASTTVCNNSDAGLSGTHLLDFSTPMGVSPGDAVGKPIGVMLQADDQGPDPVGGFFNVDNVRITSSSDTGGSSATTSKLILLRNSGTTDITSHAFVIPDASVAMVNAQVALAYNGGLWNGTSDGSGVITSSTAAADTTHLTAVGVATGLTSFEGSPVDPGDVLVMYTYYGDASLDGQVDSSDYSRIDNGYLEQLTGWQNGDFNYDGVVNGSDYTLIDDSFNNQGASLAADTANLVVAPTAQIAGVPGTNAVPEPGSMSMVMAGTALLGCRRRRRPCINNC